MKIISFKLVWSVTVMSSKFLWATKSPSSMASVDFVTMLWRVKRKLLVYSKRNFLCGLTTILASIGRRREWERKRSQNTLHRLNRKEWLQQRRVQTAQESATLRDRWKTSSRPPFLLKIPVTVCNYPAHQIWSRAIQQCSFRMDNAAAHLHSLLKMVAYIWSTWTSRWTCWPSH